MRTATVLLLALWVTHEAGPLAEAAQTRPNILLILTDDQGWGDIHSHGNEVLDTPVLDRLAQQGARFDRFFVSPVCSPTRASLLTGRYHPRCGVHGVTRGYETMRADEHTLAEYLREAGYATGCFGKWHNGAHWPQHPNAQGFDEFVGFCAGHWNNYFDTQLEHNGTLFRTKGYIADVLTDRALAFIRQHRDRPWFCYVPYNTPHSPFQVPDEYFQKYKRRGLDDTLACVYGMVENLDTNIGRLLQELDELGVADDTIVVFTTDNGPNTNRYNGGMRGRKGSVHEGGGRVPLFIRFPKRIAPGTVVERIAAHIDLLPTLLELAEIPFHPQKPLDGKSLVPLLVGDARDWPDRRLMTNWGLDDQKPGRGAVRTERWRAVIENPRRGWQLYDMLADPQQTTDVADKHPAVLAELKAAYEAWLADVRQPGFAPIPTEIGHPQAPTVFLPAHEAHLRPAIGSGISYHGRAGWANDYIDHWTDIAAFPEWPVTVVRPGRYRITLHYRAPAASLGTRLRVELGQASAQGILRKAHDPAPLPSPDRVPRKEVYEFTWAQLDLGTLTLPKGRYTLAVRALNRPGPIVMNLKAVEIRALDDTSH